MESSSRRGMANCQRIPVLYLEIYSSPPPHRNSGALIDNQQLSVPNTL